MYAKYNMNIWFIEFKKFNRQLAQAIGHFQMMIVIPVVLVIKAIFLVFNFFIASPKLMRMNEKGEYEEVQRIEVNYPRII